MDRILDLLIAYNLPDPASTERGVFNNPDLQKQQLNLNLSEAEIRKQESFQFGQVDVLADYNHFNNPHTLIPLTPFFAPFPPIRVGV